MQPEVLEGGAGRWGHMPHVITTHGFRRGGRRCCGVTADIINNNMLISCFSPTISGRLGVFFTKRNMHSQPKTNRLIIPCAEKKNALSLKELS